MIQKKKRWGVSVAALAYRLNKSGVLSDWQYRTFCIQINKRFGQSEPEGAQREKSVLWDKVFRELWKVKATKDHVAREMCIPSNEIDKLVFNLIGNINDPLPLGDGGRPALRLA